MPKRDGYFFQKNLLKKCPSLLVCVVVALGGWLCCAGAAEAGITVKVSAQNPSPFVERKITVKNYLPKGIKPENVLSTDELEVGYDGKKGQCYVYKEVVLQPSETVSYDVEIEDIWLFDEDELRFFEKQADDIVRKLVKTEYETVAKKIQADIRGQVAAAIDRQERARIESRATPIEHIGAYQMNAEVIARVKEDLLTLEKMIVMTKEGMGVAAKSYWDRTLQQSKMGKRSKTASGAAVEDSTPHAFWGQPEDTSCLVEQALKGAGDVSLTELETVRLKITAENPSITEEHRVPLQYYLAKEVKANDVTDTAGLELGFNFENGLYYLYKDDLVLAPGETKEYDIVLKNKWALGKQQLFSLKIYANHLTGALKGYKEHAEASKMNQATTATIDELLERKIATDFSEEHVTTYRKDLERLEQIKKDVRKMEDLSLQAGIVPGTAIIEEEMLCEEETLKKRQGTATIGGLRVKDIRLMAGTIFKGRSLSTASTWKLIQFIVFFLGVISGVFYFVNIRQKKSTMFDPLTGAFSRTYILDRLKEELKVAKGSQGKCSLLVLDVDKFKHVNDTHGHAAGDTILKEFVIAVRKGVRATDMIGRFGGDEFLVVLPTSAKAKAVDIGNHIAEAVRNHKVKWENQIFSITTSIGVASCPDDSMTADDLFSKADAAMYVSKRAGGGQASGYRG